MKALLFVLGVTFSLNLHSQTQRSIQQIELNLLKRQYDSVLCIANSTLEKDTTNWLVYYYSGKAYQAKFKYFEAINQYEKAVELDSANSVVENELAEAYDFVGRDEDAINIYYDQYLRDTTALEPAVNLANIFRKKREYASAIHYYQKAVAADPANFYYHKQLAFCFDKINVPIGAILTYKTAIMLNEYDVSLYIQLANILNTERAFLDAITTCNQGLEKHPQNNQLLKIKAYAQYLSRDFDSSIVYFNKLLQAGDTSFFNLK